MNLTEFLNTKWPPNQWIEEPHMRIYVRRSLRMLGNNKDGENKLTPCLDVATIEVDEEKRGKGLFTLFLSRVENEAKNLHRNVYVESIQEPRLVKFLTKRGYEFVPNTCEWNPSMFKNTTT